MSWLEAVGTFFNLASVLLAARLQRSTWLVGIIGAGLFALLFYQIRFYADAIEQLYYVAASIAGIWGWRRSGPAGPPRYGRLREQIWSAALSLGLGSMAAVVLTRADRLWPLFFPAPAVLPWGDGLTTGASFVAMGLLVQRRTEAWIYWLLIDVVSIGLYLKQGVPLLAGLYGVYTIMAVAGWRSWHREGSAPGLGAPPPGVL